MGAAALINHSRALSTSEDAGQHKAFGTGSWKKPRPMPLLVPVGATNRDQRSLFSSPKGGKQRPLVPVGGTNQD